MKRAAKFLPILMWGLFLAWLLLQIPGVVRLAEQGRDPIDFLAYRRAAEAIQQGHSPYPSIETSRQIWLSFHQQELTLLQASTPSARLQVRQAVDAGPQQPGPYIYPPTLALLVAQLRINALVFTGLSLLAMLGFAWLWLGATHARTGWLFLIIGSWDVLVSLLGGNVELLLLFAALLASWLLWRHHALLAAPLLAFVVSVKPFYALLFFAFGLLWLASHPAAERTTAKTLALALAAALAILVVEVLRWGTGLQAAALSYLTHAQDYLWLPLPPAQQTPMSAWNRTPLQALISAGLPLTAAQAAAMAIWLVLLVITIWVVRRRRLEFPLTWALALTLLYVGRPVGWTLVYLELVLLTSTWASATLGQAAAAHSLSGAHAVALVGRRAGRARRGHAAAHTPAGRPALGDMASSAVELAAGAAGGGAATRAVAWRPIARERSAATGLVLHILSLQITTKERRQEVHEEDIAASYQLLRAIFVSSYLRSDRSYLLFEKYWF